MSAFESLKTMYYSGKVKPTLTKMLAEVEKGPIDLDLLYLTCECILRNKDYKKLSVFADEAIHRDSENPMAYYYKGKALQNVKGKEQEAVKNFNKSLELEPESILFLKAKGDTHFALFSDYHLPPSLAEKHRQKAENAYMTVVDIIEQKENPSYKELFDAGDVNVLIKRNLNAKKCYLKAENIYENSAPENQDKNIFKDITKAHKACVKLIEKYQE